MKPIIRTLTVAIAASLLLTATGCSLVGKRRNEKTWQISLINGRSFGEGKNSEGKYLFAIYDGTLPTDDSTALLQLWSGERETGMELWD